VPRGLAEATRILGPGLVGTRTDTPGPYGLDWFLDELRAGPVADYFLLGQAGHGVRSWYLHYYLVEGGLALFLQIAWGGLGTDDASGAERLELAFAQAAGLLEREPGPLPPGERLVVVESDRSGRLLGRSRPGGGLALEPSADPLAEAATLG
jgi:hypothetical protein